MVAAVSSDLEKTIGWLHDIVEDTPWTVDGLTAEGFAPEVVAAVDVLTRRRGQTYAEYIEFVIGTGNVDAQMVKVADLVDHLRPNCPKHLVPRYQEAMLRIAESQPSKG